MDENGEISDLWKLADTLSIVEAALLLVNVEPQGVSGYVEGWEDEKKPIGYLAARRAIVSAINNDRVDGHVWRDYESEDIDYHRSRVEVEDLIRWLYARDYRDGFFFRHLEVSGLNDPKHPRYAPKLAAIVAAWNALEEDPEERGTPKQRLAIWLRLNASKYGLADENGLPRESVIEELAKVGNWSPGGGAPKMTQEHTDGPREDFSQDLDDEIPF